MKLPLMKPQNSQADDRVRATGPIGFCSSDPAFGIFFQNNKMLRLRSCAPTKCKSIMTGIFFNSNMMQLRNVQVPVLIHILKGRGICGMERNTTSNGYSPEAWRVHPILPSHVLRDRIFSCTEFCVHHQQNNEAQYVFNIYIYMCVRQK